MNVGVSVRFCITVPLWGYSGGYGRAVIARYSPLYL